MYVVNTPTKTLINQLKTLHYCVGDYIYFFLNKEKFSIGDPASLFYSYYQYNKAEFTDCLGFKVPSEYLLKIKSTKSAKGESFIFIDEETNTGGIYLEGNNLGFEMVLEPIDYIEQDYNFELVISGYDLAQVATLSKCYKEVFLTEKYLIGFDDSCCGFSQLSAPLSNSSFALTLDIKTTLINSLVKNNNLFFCSLTNRGLVLADDLTDPSFVFRTGEPCNLSDFQKLIIDSLDKDKGKEVFLGKGSDLCNLAGTIKTISTDKVIYLGSKGEIGYSVDNTVINITELDLILDYSFYFDASLFDKLLSCFKRSDLVSLFYIDPYHPVFITDERKLHYEAIIPYRVIELDNESTRN